MKLQFDQIKGIIEKKCVIFFKKAQLSWLYHFDPNSSLINQPKTK